MKAKRRLSNFDFAKEGCHVSLVGKSMGGAANGYSALVLKSVEKESQVEMIEKAAHEAAVQKAVADAVAPLQEKVAAMQAELEAVAVEKAAKQEADRKQAVAAVVAADKLEETFKSVKDLPAEAFEIVLKSLKAAHEAEAKSFEEKGASGEGKAGEAGSKESQILKAKYKK